MLHCLTFPIVSHPRKSLVFIIAGFQTWDLIRAISRNFVLFQGLLKVYLVPNLVLMNEHFSAPLGRRN